MNFDLKRCMEVDGGKCVTRDGREARVLCDDRKGGADFPVVVLVSFSDGSEGSVYYGSEGSVYYQSNGAYSHGERSDKLDLQNLPRKRYTVMGHKGPYANPHAIVTYSSKTQAEHRAEDTNDMLVGIFEWEEK